MQTIQHDYVMYILMFISGLLSSMNIWTNNMNDIRITLNDIYMVFLMIGWMLLFTGIYYKMIIYLWFGLIIVIVSLIFIKNQIFISEKQYIKNMIPHHSMAILMSKKLLKNNKNITPKLAILANNIIDAQEKEIQILKQLEKL
jgi:hypothetical protein